MAYRTERSPSVTRSHDGRAPSVLRRVVSTLTSPFAPPGPVQRAASEGDDRAWVQSGGRSSSLVATGKESAGRDAAARARPTATCRSCGETLAPQLAERCRGCNGLNHNTCFGNYEESESHTAFMCFKCGGQVLQWINTVEAMMVRHSQVWRKDAWCLSLVNTVSHNFASGGHWKSYQK